MVITLVKVPIIICAVYFSFVNSIKSLLMESMCGQDAVPLEKVLKPYGHVGTSRACNTVGRDLIAWSGQIANPIIATVDPGITRN